MLDYSLVLHVEFVGEEKSGFHVNYHVNYPYLCIFPIALHVSFSD